MQVVFRDRRLERCYRVAAEAYQAWGPLAGRAYIRRIDAIQAAPTLAALFATRSLRLHPLHGPLAGRHAAVLVDRWRLILTLDPPIVTIEEVSRHYGD